MNFISFGFRVEVRRFWIGFWIEFEYNFWVQVVYKLARLLL